MRFKNRNHDYYYNYEKLSPIYNIIIGYNPSNTHFTGLHQMLYTELKWDEVYLDGTNLLNAFLLTREPQAINDYNSRSSSENFAIALARKIPEEILFQSTVIDKKRVNVADIALSLNYLELIEYFLHAYPQRLFDIFSEQTFYNPNFKENTRIEHLAAQQNNVRLMKIIISKRLPLQVFDSYGRTPLYYATSKEMFDLLLPLVNDQREDNYQETALSYISRTITQDIKYQRHCLKKIKKKHTDTDNKTYDNDVLKNMLNEINSKALADYLNNNNTSYSQTISYVKDEEEYHFSLFFQACLFAANKCFDFKNPTNTSNLILLSNHDDFDATHQSINGFPDFLFAFILAQHMNEKTNHVGSKSRDDNRKLKSDMEWYINNYYQDCPEKFYTDIIALTHKLHEMQVPLFNKELFSSYLLHMSSYYVGQNNTSNRKIDLYKSKISKEIITGLISLTFLDYSAISKRPYSYTESTLLKQYNFLEVQAILRNSERVFISSVDKLNYCIEMMNLHNHYYQKILDKETHPNYHYNNDDMRFTEDLSHAAIDALNDIHESYQISKEDRDFLMEFTESDDSEHQQMKAALLKFNLYEKMMQNAPKRAASKENRL